MSDSKERRIMLGLDKEDVGNTLSLMHLDGNFNDEYFSGWNVNGGGPWGAPYTPQFTTGKFGQCLVPGIEGESGEYYTSMNNGPQLDMLNEDYTVEMFVKRTKNPKQSGNSFEICLASGAIDLYLRYGSDDPSYMSLFIDQSGQSAWTKIQSGLTTQDLFPSINTWYHTAVVWQFPYLRIYTGGINKYNFNLTSYMTNPKFKPQPMMFWFKTDLYNIDEIRISKGALYEGSQIEVPTTPFN